MKVRPQIFLALCLLFGSISALGQTPKQALNDQFWEAVRQGDLALVTSLLDQGADVNAKFRYGTTALFKAAERGHLEIVKLLLARGADVTVKDTFYGQNAMSWALNNDNVEVVKVILEKDPDSVGDVLMTGVREGKPPLVDIALASGKVKADALTPALVVATDEKNAEIIELLKKAGAVPPPAVDAALAQSFVGKYKDEAGTEITISFTDGQLSALVTGQRPFALMALGNNSFRPVAFDGIVITFKPEGMELKRGTNTSQLKRVVEAKP
ncbi:MAG TPA: ankyrin repeat domain-containing protein [Pyrinomonadaceae bacterium]|jgi:hypothetical protein|nr:ankyrin repeat domain-containing protein [Pyrinomonadaceae bacterium]